MLLTVVSLPVGGGTVALEPAYSDNLYDPHESPVTMTAQPSAGYVFAEWTGDVAGITDVTDNAVSVAMTQDKTITANFVASWVRHTVTAAAEPLAGGWVTVSPVQDNYSVNQVVSFSAVATPGYAFDHWAGDLAGTSSPVDLRLNGSKSVTAVFYPVLSAGVETAGSGTVEADPPATSGGYPAGETVRVYALAAEGYAFSRWTGDASGTDPILQLIVSQGLAVGAVFDPTVTFEGDPAEGGEVEITPPQASGGYVAGSEVTIEARPAQGYRFTGWSGDASGGENPVTVVVDSPKTVTAVFAKQLVIPWWAIAVAAVLALLVLVGAPLEVMLTRRSEGR